MRYLILLVFCINLFALEYKSNLSYSYISYDEFVNENLIDVDTKLKYEGESYSINSTFEYLYSSEYSKKRYLDINELYLNYEFSNSNLYFGKQIKYWGELESYNIADIFNKKRYLADPFDKSKKIGSYTLNDTFYFDDSSLELGVKFYEEDIDYPNSNAPYYPFSLNYSDDLQTTHSKYTPSIYLKYGFTSEILESENKLIFWYGYDSKRVIVLDNQSLKQKAYISSKLIYLSNFIYGDYIFKIESVISDVKSDLVSDYAQVAFGVEKSLYDIKGSDLAFYLEYYKYKYFNDKQKNIDISEVYDDDIFIAVKINLNDVDSTQIKAGTLLDKNSSERVLKVELSSRLIDSVVLNGEVLKIVAKDDSPLSPFGNTTRVSFGLTYSF